MTETESNNEITGNNSLGQKHNEWLKSARIIAEGIGFHVIVGVSATTILKALGADLPPEIFAVLPAPSTIQFIRLRQKQLNK